MEAVANTDQPVTDITVDTALKLTRTEWTIYWKTKYEGAVQRIASAKILAGKVHAEMLALKQEHEKTEKLLKERAQEIEGLKLENATLSEQNAILTGRSKSKASTKVTVAKKKKKKAVRKRK